MTESISESSTHTHTHTHCYTFIQTLLYVLSYCLSDLQYLYTGKMPYIHTFRQSNSSFFILLYFRYNKLLYDHIMLTILYIFYTVEVLYSYTNSYDCQSSRLFCHTVVTTNWYTHHILLYCTDVRTFVIMLLYCRTIILTFVIWSYCKTGIQPHYHTIVGPFALYMYAATVILPESHTVILPHNNCSN